MIATEAGAEGIDFEKRVAAIYQNSRKPEEIATAFNQLQLELSLEINASMTRTRQQLLENFDDEVREKLKMRDEASRAYHHNAALVHAALGASLIMPRATPSRQRRFPGCDRTARLVSLAASTLAMPYGNRPDDHFAGAGKKPGGDERPTVTEPTIACPNCKTEIRLTESLSTPLISATRQAVER